MPKTKQSPPKSLTPKTQAKVDEVATTIAELLLEVGVELEELSRMDERVPSLVRRMGNKALERIAKKKVDSTVAQNEDLGLKAHRSKMIEFEYTLGPVGIESPYMWLKECGGIRPTSELFGLNARGRRELVNRALTDFGAEESFGQESRRFEEHCGWAIGRTSILRVVEAESVRAEAFVKEGIEEQLKVYEAKEPWPAGRERRRDDVGRTRWRRDSHWETALTPGAIVTPIRKSPRRIRTTQWRVTAVAPTKVSC